MERTAPRVRKQGKSFSVLFSTHGVCRLVLSARISTIKKKTVRTGVRELECSSCAVNKAVLTNAVSTLYSRLYNRLYEHGHVYSRLGELCKWVQPSGAWAVQPGRLWRHLFDAQQGAYVDSRRDVARLIDF